MNEFKDRRSIRRYSTRKVPDELLETLAQEASRAATMGNMQLYSLVITTDGEVRRQLAQAHDQQPMACQAPVLLTFCADFNRFSKWCMQRDAMPGYGNPASLANAVTDALLFAQAYITLAEQRGLGTCILGTTIANPGMIIDILGLPPLVLPVLAVAAGWPGEQPEQTDRLPVEAITHKDRYRDYSPEDIDRFFAFKEALPENRHYVELNGTDNLAQVFTRFRFTEKANQAMSSRLVEAIRKQGFSGMD